MNAPSFMPPPQTTPYAAAEWLLLMGLNPVPLRPKTKKPAFEKWQEGRFDVNDLKLFAGDNPHNVGVRLCEIVDIDLDWPCSTFWAAKILGDLPAFGRPGKPHSHRLVRAPGSTFKQFTLPGVMTGQRGLPTEHKLCIVELRAGKGKQTVFPGSTHEDTGEHIEWSNGAPGDFPDMEAETLRKHVGLVAFMSYLEQFFPDRGVRNDFMMAVAGALAHAGYKGATIQRLVQSLGERRGDPGKGGKWDVASGRAPDRVKADAPTTGIPTIVQILGHPEAVAKTLTEWLCGEKAEAADRVDPNDKRPHVHYDEHGDLDGSLNMLDAALVVAEVPIYRMGKRIVHAYRLKKKTTEDGITREAGSLVLDTVSPERLYRYMVKHIRCTHNATSWGKRKKALGLPRSAVKDYAASPDQMSLRILRGTAEHPILRADGTLVAAEGYDEASGMLLNFGGEVFPAIPENPTREQALAALATIKEVFKDFPFVPDEGETERSVSRSVALSAVFSPFVCRPMGIPCPLHAVTAPCPVTGKTLLLNTAALITTGRKAPAMTWSNSEEENIKQLDGLLLRGDAILSIDNIDTPLGGKRLCVIVTDDEVQMRILGATGQHDVPTDIVVYANGNNIVIYGDLASRTVMCMLDARMEKPEERVIERDLETWVPENRPKLIAAVLTVLRFNIAAGRPWDATKHKESRFKKWDRTVRGALLHLGEPDPCGNRDRIESIDPKRSNLETLVEAILETEIKERTPFSAAGLVKQSTLVDNNQWRYPALVEALEEVCTKGVTVKAVSAYLTEVTDRIVGGRRIEMFIDTHDKNKRFRILPVRHGTVAVEPTGQTSMDV